MIAIADIEQEAIEAGVFDVGGCVSESLAIMQMMLVAAPHNEPTTVGALVVLQSIVGADERIYPGPQQ